MAASMNAASVKKTTGWLKPPAAAGNLPTAPPMTRSMGISNPVTPTGSASVIHISVAHARTASVDFPAFDMPSGSGIIHKIKKNTAHATKKPIKVFAGARPRARMFSKNRPKKVLVDGNAAIPVVSFVSFMLFMLPPYLRFAAVRLTRSTPIVLPPSLTGTAIWIVSMLVLGSGLDSPCCHTLPLKASSKFGLPLPR